MDKQYPIPYKVDPSLIGLDDDAKGRIRVGWNAEARQFDGSKYEAEKIQDSLVLIPAKLADVANALKDREYRVVSAVVFNTMRSDDLPNIYPSLKRIYSSEPIAAGFVIAEWLAGYFNLEFGREAGKIGINISGWVDFLHGEMISPGPSERDDPVNRKAANLIDAAIHESASWEPDLWACVSTGGGMPPVKDVIKACAEYRFDRQVFTWVVPEYPGGPRPKLVKPDEEPVSPSDSFRARLHASHLLGIGDFVGAYRAVETYKEDNFERKWVTWLERTADYFTGQLKYDAGGLPEWLNNLLRSRPRCLVVGMRAEVALTMNRIPEAVAWTCTFFDAALRDAVEMELQGELDDVARTIKIHEGRSLPRELMEDIRGSDGKSFGACLTKISSRPKPSYRIETGGVKDERWLQYLEGEGHPALKAFYDALRARNGGIGPKELRNINMHSRIEPADMQQCIDAFVKPGLWFIPVGEAEGSGNVSAQRMAGNTTIQVTHETKLGCRFLGLSMAASVLKKLGIEDAAGLYVELVEGLLRALSDYKIR